MKMSVEVDIWKSKYDSGNLINKMVKKIKSVYTFRKTWI